MESLLGNYDEGANFWKLYPTYKVPTIYNELYKSDKSKNKTRSSTIMWALIYLFDKTAANPYRNLQKEDRLEVIKEDILMDNEFDWDSIKDLVNYTQELHMTEIERTYYSFIEKMEQRRKLIEDSDYTLDTADTLDKIIKATESVRKELDNLKKLVDQQESSHRTKGNITLSHGEQGLI